MEDSNIKELYDFLKNYDLIQADLDEDQALEYISSIFSNLNPEESLLTGFIANAGSGEHTEPRAFFITSEDRVLLYPIDEEFPGGFYTKDVEFVEENPDNSLSLKLKNLPNVLNIITDDAEGIETISDALYSSFGESLSEDEINEIFGEEIEEDEDEIEEAPPTEETAEFAVIEEMEPEESNDELQPVETESLSVTNSADLVPSEEEVEENELIVPNTALEEQPKETEMVTFSSNTGTEAPNYESGVKSAEVTEQTKKGFHLTKPMIYTIAGIGILALLLVGYLIYSRISTSRHNNEVAAQLIDYLNQSDEVYFTLKDYQAANFAGITVENMDALNNQAQGISDSLIELEPNADTDELYQSIYFYNDALLSSIYYGRVFITTQNQLNRLSFDSMLDAAYRYRISILRMIRQNYPDLIDQVKTEPDMDLDAEFAESEANSTPSQGALNRENSVSSNEALENSTSSRENYQNSKSSREDYVNSQPTQ